MCSSSPPPPSLPLSPYSIITELEEGNSLCRREAAWVFLNMCECGAEPHRSVIPEMVELGVISAVCHNLDKEADPGETLKYIWHVWDRQIDRTWSRGSRYVQVSIPF